MTFDLDFPRAYSLLDACALFRAEPDDFFVDERLGFEFSGSGEHLCLHIEKRSQNTVWLAKQLAELAGIKQMDVGYCGLKDRHAVTRQWFSLYLGKRDFDWRSLRIDGCEILAASRHDKKLRPGIHEGNAFVIRLRNVQGDRGLLDQRWRDIAATGVPNYFGEQRFGRGGNNLLRAVELMDAHARIWRERKNQFVTSAVRSWLFNHVLADRVVQHDWQNPVEGEPLEFATAPLWGRGRALPASPLLEREQMLLAPYAMFCDKLEHLGLQQERRALSLLPTCVGATWESHDWLLSFFLPPGTYATSVLREILVLEKVQQDREGCVDGLAESACDIVTP